MSEYCQKCKANKTPLSCIECMEYVCDTCGRDRNRHDIRHHLMNIEDQIHILLNIKRRDEKESIKDIEKAIVRQHEIEELMKSANDLMNAKKLSGEKHKGILESLKKKHDEYDEFLKGKRAYSETLQKETNILAGAITNSKQRRLDVIAHQSSCPSI